MIMENFCRKEKHFTESRFTSVLHCEFPFMPNSHTISNFTQNHAEIIMFFLLKITINGEIVINGFHILFTYYANGES